uniref:Shisa family member 6 n=1 Tax=Sinocyclocheilus rhinocerous TaxID=307959 RepID=A0A673JT28_9TELE
SAFAVVLRVTPATCPWTLQTSGLHVYCTSTRTTTQKIWMVFFLFESSEMIFDFFPPCRALADILRQQGPIPISQYDHENIAAIDTSPKENTPVRTSKNHYTPVHNKNNHGERSVSLQSLTRETPPPKPRMNNILTSQTEPYDLSFSRSFQNLTHLPPSYEMAVKVDLSTYSSLHYCGKDDEYYIRKHHLPDPTPRGGNLQTHMIKLNVDPPAQRQKPKRVQRAMSQDHVLSGGAGGLPPYHGRILSEEQLLSTDRLHSQDPLLSSDKMLSLRRSDFREKAMSRALSHTDMFMPTTPVMDRHCKMMKMHSHPSSSNNESYNTLTVNSAQVGNKRQAFASRRMHTVDHLQYIPGHHHHQYRTASKTEVTV